MQRTFQVQNFPNVKHSFISVRRGCFRWCLLPMDLHIFCRSIAYRIMSDLVHNLVFQRCRTISCLANSLKLKRSQMCNEVPQSLPELLQTQSTWGRIFCKNVAKEGRLTGLERVGYKTENNSSKIRNNMQYLHSMSSYKTFLMKSRHLLTSIRDICLVP